MAGARQRLAKLVERLPEEQQRQLLEFAEFLAERHARDEDLPTAPLPIPRPAEESVVAAIRRLSRTYPMLGGEELLSDASALMSRHVLQGHPATAVIDELETLFRERFEALQPSD